MFLLNFSVISIYTRFNCIVCVSQKSVCDFTDSAVCLTLSLRCSNSTKRIERTPTDRPTYISYSLLHVNFLSLILPSVSFTHAVIRSLLSAHMRCLLLVFSRSLWFVCFFLYGELDVRRWNVFVCESVCLYACVWKTPLHLRCSAALTRRINTYEIRFSSGKSQSHNTHRHIHHIGVWIRFKHQYRFVVVCICVCVCV